MKAKLPMASTWASLAPRDRGRPGLPPLWRRPWLRAIAYQVLALAAAVAVIVYFVGNVRQNLPRTGHDVGWQFLKFPAHFDIDDNFIGATGRDPVWMAFLAGATNTVAVSIVAILACSLLALAVALARLSSNWLLSRVALLYIETVRNIPLLLQLLFWYSLSTLFPLPRNAWQPLPGLFITNRGVMFPTLGLSPAVVWALSAAGAGLFLVVAAVLHGRRQRRLTGRPGSLAWYAAAAAVILPVVILLLGSGGLVLDYPVLKGFNFVGGSSITPEFVAVAAGLAVYQSGFTAETIRSGILGVRRGQIEAARSLGLRTSQTMWLVTMPQALRIIIPPLTSQFLSLTKSSSLGVVVGYPELMRVTTGVISETSRAFECIAIIMSIYLSLSLLTSLLMSWFDRRMAYVER